MRDIFITARTDKTYDLLTARHAAKTWEDPHVVAEEKALLDAEEEAKEAFRKLEKSRHRAKLQLYLERYVSDYERDILELTRIGCPQAQIGAILGRSQPTIGLKLQVLRERFQFLDRWPGTGIDADWLEWQLNQAEVKRAGHFAALVRHNGSRLEAAKSLGIHVDTYKYQMRAAIPSLEKTVRQADTDDMWRVWDSILPLLNRAWRLTTIDHPIDHKAIEQEIQDVYDELWAAHKRHVDRLNGRRAA